MPSGGPSFRPYPYDQLPRVSRREAAALSVVARWLRVATPAAWTKLSELAGAPVRVALVGLAHDGFDPHAAHAEVRVAGLALDVAGSSRALRLLAQRLVGGPAELDGPRPLTLFERSAFCLVVAAALTDANLPGDVWPVLDPPPSESPVSSSSWSSSAAGGIEPTALARPRPAPRAATPDRIDLVTARTELAPTLAEEPGARRGRRSEIRSIAVELAISIERRVRDRPASGDEAMTLTAIVRFPAELALRVPPSRPRGWTLDLPVVVAACALPREAVGRLAPRDIVVVERALALAVGEGVVRLAAEPGAIEARVASEYVPRPMLADDAHLELTVQLGTTRLPVRRIAELAVGEVVSLGKPLAGPYEIRVAGRLIGQGELIEVDGELGVRIVSIVEE